MNIQVKIFPIAGCNDTSHEIEITLSQGHLGELMSYLQQYLGKDLHDESVMVLHNGQGLDLNSDVQFKEADKVWVMPRLSGG